MSGPGPGVSPGRLGHGPAPTVPARAAAPPGKDKNGGWPDARTARPFRDLLLAGTAGQELKFAIAGAQPTPWIHTFWIPAISGAMSPAETIICAVKDSSLPSPAR